MIFGLGLLPFAPSVLIYCGIISLMSFGTGINNPSISALLSKSSSGDEQGGIMGIAQSLASLARILGPVWGGYAFDGMGHVWPFLSAALLMSMAFLLSLRNLSRAQGGFAAPGK